MHSTYNCLLVSIILIEITLNSYVTTASSRSNSKIQVERTRVGDLRNSGKRKVISRISDSETYYKWANRRNLKPYVRYADSGPSIIREAITLGYILIPRRLYYTSNVRYSDSFFNNISVCYNERPLYDRNVTASPWFVCPWDNDGETECCEDVDGEKCCNPPLDYTTLYHVAMVIATICLCIFLIYHSRRKIKRLCNSWGIMNNTEVNEMAKLGSTIVYPPYFPVNNANTDPATNTKNDYASDPHQRVPDDNQEAPRYQAVTTDNAENTQPPSYEDVVDKSRLL